MQRPDPLVAAYGFLLGLNRPKKSGATPDDLQTGGAAPRSTAISAASALSLLNSTGIVNEQLVFDE